MARVFVALYNFCRIPEDYTAMPPFFESFLTGLKETGNDVCCFQTKKVTNRGFQQEIPAEMREMLLDFNPELCILFNNNFWDISKLVECPIVIYDVDSPLEWQLIDNLRENTERYLFVYNQTAAKKILLEDFCVAEKQCRFIPFFSEIRADNNTIMENDIVFLGTNWIWKGYNFLNQFIKSGPSESDVQKAKNVLEQYILEPLTPSHEIYYELESRPHERINFGNLRRCALEVSGYRRIQVLSAVSDLGLKVYGAYWTIDAMNYYPDVLSCVQKKRIWTKEESEHFYNASRIALNTKHIQAKNGFSFRVCDILASNACLVTEKSQDLDMYFPKVGIPSFTTPMEAREQCLKLLNDESLRQEIISSAHEEIDENFRFKNVLESLEDFTRVTLVSNRPGTLYIFPQDENSSQTDSKQNLSDSLPRINTIYYNTIGKHLGYDPYHRFPEKRIYLGKVPVLKMLQTSKNRKEVYIGCVPIVSYNTEQGRKVVRILLLEKMNSALKKSVNLFKQRFLNVRPLKKKSHLKRLRQRILSGEKVKICLFVSRIDCWMFEDVYKILKEGDIFEPVIVVKPFLSRGMEHMKECMNSTYEALLSRGYAPIKGYDEETETYFNVREKINPDIVFYTKFWKPHFHPNFYIDKFRDKVTLLIDYGYNVTGYASAMNFPLQNAVDIYFYYSPIQKEIAAHYMRNHASNVLISGSPKIDRIFDKSYIPRDVWKPQKKAKKRIIWAPHHEDKTGKGMYQLDAFYDLYDVMPRIAEKYQDQIQIAFKPHPLLKTKLLDKWGEVATEAYYAQWEKMENGQLEEGEFIDLFLLSDAMILDCLSFIAEYTATYKPALFTVGSNSRVLLNELGNEIYQFLYHAEGDLEKEICNFIETVVIGGNDPLYQSRCEFVQHNLIPPNGKTAAENVCNYIYDYIMGEK